MSLELVLIISLFILLGLIAFLMLRFVQTKRASVTEEQVLNLIARELQETMKELSLQFTRAMDDERRAVGKRVDGISRTTDALKDGIRELATLTDQRFGEFARSVERHIASLRETQQSLLAALAKFTAAAERQLTEDRAAVAAELDRLSAAVTESLTQFAAAVDRAFADARARELQTAQRIEEANRALVKEFLSVFERRAVQGGPPAPHQAGSPAPILGPLAETLAQKIARERAGRAEAAPRPALDTGREVFELLAKQPESAGPFTVESGAASLTRQVMNSIAQKTVTPLEPSTQKRPATMEDVLGPDESLRRAERTSPGIGVSAPSARPEVPSQPSAAQHSVPMQSAPVRSSTSADTPTRTSVPTDARSPGPAMPHAGKPVVPVATPSSGTVSGPSAPPAVSPTEPPLPAPPQRSAPGPDKPSPVSPANRDAARDSFKQLVVRYAEEWKEEHRRRPSTILNAKQIIGRMADDLVGFKNANATVLDPSFIGKLDLAINDARSLRAFTASTIGAFQEFWKRGEALIGEVRRLEKLV